MVSLRWKYQLHVDVEDTRDFAMDKGLQVFELEGQSRRFLEPYPLNQIKIKGSALGSNVKVIVSPYTSQIYFSIEDAPGIDKLENLVENLWKVEQILRARCRNMVNYEIA